MSVALGPAAQYQGFGTFNKIDSSVWTLTGTSTFAGPVNVNGGTLAVNGDITSASGVTVNAGGTLGGNGIVGNTHDQCRRHAGAGQFDRAIADRAAAASRSQRRELAGARSRPPTPTDQCRRAAATLGGATVDAAFADRHLSFQCDLYHPECQGGLNGTPFDGSSATPAGIPGRAELHGQRRAVSI